jgi:lipopolysaccharide biosynthesis glycosyltransferase
MKRKTINIMSSCDENYAKLVPVQLLSIADNLIGIYDVNYFLFHNRVSKKTIAFLNNYCEKLGIAFHEIYVENTEPYAELASKGGGWVYEAYLSLDCHKYLPLEVERVLYIDAADVLIIGDIGEYYFSNFDNCSIIATCARDKQTSAGNFVVFDRDDLGKEESRLGIMRGLFNSGSYIMNLKKLRNENSSIADFIAMKNALVEIYPNKDDVYFGDQGLLGVAFAGDIKYFGYSEIKNLWYQPYNFCIWFFDRATEICGGNPWYIPKILHFAGGIKPWSLTSENEKELKPGQWPYYKMYQLYAGQVPSK